MVASYRECCVVNGFRSARFYKVSEVVNESLIMMKGVAETLGLIVECNVHPLVQITGNFETFGNQFRFKLASREYLRVWTEENRRPRASGTAQSLETAGRLAALERLLPLEALSLRPRDEVLRESVDDAGADPM